MVIKVENSSETLSIVDPGQHVDGATLTSNIKGDGIYFRSFNDAKNALRGHATCMYTSKSDKLNAAIVKSGAAFIVCQRVDDKNKGMPLYFPTIEAALCAAQSHFDLKYPEGGDVIYTGLV